MIQSIKVLNSLRHPNGLFSAAAKTVSTGYDKAWIRDNVYAALGVEMYDPTSAILTYQTLLDIFKKHESKIIWAINNKPTERYQYIHARFHPQTLDEIWGEWGNKQNDAIGATLFKIADLQMKGLPVIRDESDISIIQKLVDYLESVQYWLDEDNGVWEENEEIHASSVGACLAGLKKLEESDIQVHIPKYLISLGQATLDALLPRESMTKEVDLALLSLIYPFNVVTDLQRKQILRTVEEKLVRENGVIRYANDVYYVNEKNGKEAEWCFGFPWLAVIYKMIGNDEKYDFYMYKTNSIMTEDGEIPELYYGGTDDYNENTPLGWAQAMYLCALNETVAEN